MRVLSLLLILAVGSASAASVCSSSTAPRLPTVSGWGDSIMFGVCSGGPLEYLRASLPGWWTSNKAVSGETAAQIRARYTAEEATSCYGQRCGVLWLEGGVNELRAGVTPAATLTDMVWIVDDALARGYIVVWTDVLPYKTFSGAGVNPGALAAAYSCDGIHHTVAGGQLMASRSRTAISTP